MKYSYSSDNDLAAKCEYAIVIYLPDELEKIVAPLREKFDPDYSLVSAHITVAFPFGTVKTPDQLSPAIRQIADQIGPVPIELSSIGDFYPSAPIIYWQVGPSELLSQLHGSLCAALDLPLPFKKYIPHVTVAKEISNHRVIMVKDEVASFLPDETFGAGTLDLISPVAADQWVSVRTFKLSD